MHLRLVPFGEVLGHMIQTAILSAVVWRVQICYVALHLARKHVGILVIYPHTIVALRLNHTHLEILEFRYILAISLILSYSVGDAVGTVYQRCHQHVILLHAELRHSRLNLLSYISNLSCRLHTEILSAEIDGEIILGEQRAVHVVHLVDEVFHSLLDIIAVSKEGIERDKVGVEEVVEYHLLVIIQSLVAHSAGAGEHVEERARVVRHIINNGVNPANKFSLASHIPPVSNVIHWHVTLREVAE